MSSLLRHGLALLRAPAIELGFALRATLRWQRGQPVVVCGEPSGDLYRWAPTDVRAGLAARARQLARDYDLGSLPTVAPAIFCCQNLARLEGLQRLAGALEVPAGPSGRVRAADLGCGDFHYAPALHQWLSRHGAARPRPVELRGIELDGYGIYRDGYSRADHARRWAAVAGRPGSTVEFAVEDANRVSLAEQDVVSLFFPFLTAYACLSWGAPLTRLRPRRMLRRAVQALRPGGWLVVANQTVDEHARLCRLLADLPVARIARRSLATGLAPEAWRRGGQIGSIWRRQEEVRAGKSSG